MLGETSLHFGRQARQRRGTGDSRQPQEIREQLEPVLGQHRFGMELDSYDRMIPMGYSHQGVVIRPCRRNEAGRKAALVDRKRMIAARLHRIRKPGKHALAIMIDP